MITKENGAYWIAKLGLRSHGEGGWYREVWTADLEIPASALPPEYGGSRSSCSLIYYLLQAGEVSHWHKLRSPEIWVWHCGGLLEQTLGGGGPAPAAGAVRLLGPGPEEGASFQSVIPAGEWQTTRLRAGDFALVSCVVSPAFRPEDFSLLDVS
ncbi:MAG: cupin domain-containing protein [Treponema sp.]|jgi:predicted cupin superfamily sugar epimerase|nr:cupin domain-containing protein [Treponema sp.]